MTFDIHKLGIEELNVMQQEMQRHFRREKSLVLLSATGTGKTLAYLMPLLESLNTEATEVQALILVPSRELAQQTAAVLRQLTGEVKGLACYGGRPAMDEHRSMMQIRPHVIIGTPGRIMDHIRKENFNTEHISTLVIDEFDKSLELGFQQQMSNILGSLRNMKKRVLLSATDSPSIPQFVGHDFCRISYLDEGEMSERIALKLVHSPEKDKLQTLLRLLCMLGDNSCLVFVNHRESVERVGQFLSKNGVSADIYHGGMEQKDRERAIFRYSNGSSNVLISTDLASRGLDIPETAHVIHYHLPLNEEAFIHRNGRTARWDANGCAWLILGPEETFPQYIAEEAEEVNLPEGKPVPAKPRWVTLYIGKGKRDKVNKVDIMGFLAKTGGLKHEEVGRIDVMPDWSYVAVSRTCAPALLNRVKGQKIKGMKTIIALSNH